MTMSHLEHTVAMLERGSTIRMHKMHNEALTWCPPQGELAAMSFEDGMDELLEDVCMGNFEKYVNPIYFDMLREMEYRISNRQAQLNKYTLT